MSADLLDIAHAEDGHYVQTIDFDYDEVDRSFKPVQLDEPQMFTEEEVRAAIKLLQTLLRWQWQTITKNEQGGFNRMAICCWIFLAELRSLTLTDLARGFGKDKQSLGRHVDQFKKAFPYIKTPHMQ